MTAQPEAIRATNGELAWKREDIPQVIAKLTDSGKQILGCEVWAVVTPDNDPLTKMRKLMQIDDGRVALGLIPGKDGKDGVYSFSVDLNGGESASDYILSMIKKMDAENDVATEFSQSLYYNLSWI